MQRWVLQPKLAVSARANAGGAVAGADNGSLWHCMVVQAQRLMRIPPYPCAQMQLVHLVAVEAFDAALEVAGEANPDVRPRDLQGAFPPIKPDTWPEVRSQATLRVAPATPSAALSARIARCKAVRCSS